MKIKFTKMEGCGNDYIYINCFEENIKSPRALAVRLSDRRFGVGGDGIILILPSKKADAKMRIFNIDGSEGRMCGNGIRCVAKYLYDNNIVRKENIAVETLSGVKGLKLAIKKGLTETVKVDMGRPELRPAKIPVNLAGKTIIAKPIAIDGKKYNITCVSMGNPHAVVFCKNVDGLDLAKIGPLFENNSLFPDRINTEFVQILSKTRLKMRVWERGSGETLACGTGACASVVAAVLNNLVPKGKDIKVELAGGNLLINYNGDKVFMTGPCKKVFEGVVEM
ncbi:MAG: diaminopimelate epimerase [Elusimicrobiota bacterium]|jgi:carbamoyl-phosphate synthase large subunit|nr:diaminopimelate epimerase [Elusimicrobiota bacterium]